MITRESVCVWVCLFWREALFNPQLGVQTEVPQLCISGEVTRDLWETRENDIWPHQRSWVWEIQQAPFSLHLLFCFLCHGNFFQLHNHNLKVVLSSSGVYILLKNPSFVKKFDLGYESWGWPCVLLNILFLTAEHLKRSLWIMYAMYYASLKNMCCIHHPESSSCCLIPKRITLLSWFICSAV